MAKGGEGDTWDEEVDFAVVTYQLNKILIICVKSLSVSQPILNSDVVLMVVK